MTRHSISGIIFSIVKSPVTTIKPFFSDSRGEMSHLLEGDEKFSSAVLITCKKGSIRANHWHKKDTHYSYMLEGSMEYTYKPVGADDSKKKTILVKKGDMVCTPPNTVHAMKFLEKSVFIALTTEARDHKQYEKDTVRITLVE